MPQPGRGWVIYQRARFARLLDMMEDEGDALALRELYSDLVDDVQRRWADLTRE